MAGIRGDQARVKPVTAHPLFPTIVTLWCGALLGLGSLAIHPATLQDLVQKSPAAHFFSANLPPVNWTGRTLLAIAFALIGCLIGLAVAAIAIRLYAARRARATLAEEGLDQPESAGLDLQNPAPKQDLARTTSSVDQVILPPLEEPERVKETVHPILNFATIAQAFEVAKRPLNLNEAAPTEGSEAQPGRAPLRSYSFPIPHKKTATAPHTKAVHDQSTNLPAPTAAEREETQRALREALFYLKQLRGKS